MHIEISEFKNCHFFDHILSGSTDIFLFNISLSLGFKLYSVTNVFYEFVFKNRLPELKEKRKNKLILRLIWIGSIADLTIFVFMNIFWTYIDRDIYSLNTFLFWNRVVEVLMILFNSVLFFMSYRKFGKTLKGALVDIRQKKIFMARRMMLIMGILYFSLDFILFLGLYS